MEQEFKTFKVSLSYAQEESTSLKESENIFILFYTHESRSNRFYNPCKMLYRHPSLPSLPKKFLLHNELKIFRTTRFREQSFLIAGGRGGGF